LIHHGDVHHIFPQAFLKRHGLTQGRYNQVANLVYLQQEINIKIGDKAPHEYVKEVLEQCNSGDMKYGAIVSNEELEVNLAQNALPTLPESYMFENYEAFLVERRKKMASIIKQYYFSLSGKG
jgi:hypothetical protein